MSDKKKALFDSLVKKVEGIVSGGEIEPYERLRSVCKLLKEEVAHYNWVGFYIVDKKNKNELFLGPYEGEPTVHTRIPFGKGICGQAAAVEKPFLVQDVSQETNYLACSMKTKSEVVLPIFKGGEFVAELDIDSHMKNAFDDLDLDFLKRVCDIVSALF
ncbi:MAG: GAF domain-containing protein [Planctomycetota bacterium]|nr:GAF domain-containing protein [Planctomycetota bacterium]